MFEIYLAEEKLWVNFKHWLLIKKKCYVYLIFPLTVSNIKSLAMQDPNLSSYEVKKVIPFCYPNPYNEPFDLNVFP